MTAITHQRRIDRLAIAIAQVRQLRTGHDEATVNIADPEFHAALQAAVVGDYWPSQRDAEAALHLAADIARAHRSDGVDFDDLEALIQIGLERLKRMGL